MAKRDPNKPKKDPFADEYRPYGVNKGKLGTPAQWRKAYEDRMSAEEAQAVLDEGVGSPSFILGLQPGYTSYDVKKAYRRLALMAHPDQGGTVEAFKRLNAAYSMLMQEFD